MLQLPNDDDVYLIGCTRFNEETLQTNYEYRQRYSVPVIYGTSLLIRERYPLYAITFVLEMNNSLNRIERIGRIRNHASVKEWKHIYKNSMYAEYNAYFYVGKQWRSRQHIMKIDPKLLDIFEQILFKGKTHVKRQAGITVITEKLLLHWFQDKTDIARAKQGLMMLLNRILKVFAE